MKRFTKKLLVNRFCVSGSGACAEGFSCDDLGQISNEYTGLSGRPLLGEWFHLILIHCQLDLAG